MARGNPGVLRAKSLTRPGMSSKFKGVERHSSGKKWMSRIYVGGAHVFLGYFKREEDAARAYESTAREFGLYPVAAGVDTKCVESDSET